MILTLFRAHLEADIIVSLDVHIWNKGHQIPNDQITGWRL